MAVTPTNKFSGDVNQTLTAGNQGVVNTSVGTVTTGGLLVVSQTGIMYRAGAGIPDWATPVKQAGTATIGTPVLIGSGFPTPGTEYTTARTNVWAIPVTSGGTLTLQTNEILPDSSVSYGWTLHVDEILGHDSTTPIVGAVVRTWDSGSGGQNQVASDSTLGATPTTDDLVYSVACWDTDTGAASATPGSGFSEFFDIQGGYVLSTGQSKTGVTSTTVDWPNETSVGNTYSFVGVAFIIKAATGPTEPNDPTSVTATPGNTEVNLSWTAPVSDGGSAITDYVIQWSEDDGSPSWTTFTDGTSTSTSVTVTGLTNGTAYIFRVAAVNAIGQGAYSANSNSETPSSPSIGYRLTMAGDQVLTMAGDFVLLMGGAPAGPGGGPIMKRWNGSTWVAVVMKHGASWTVVELGTL